MPLAAIGLVFLLLVIVSECRDSKKSDFAGNFTSLLSIIEAISWFIYAWNLSLKLSFIFILAWLAIIGNIICNLSFLSKYRKIMSKDLALIDWKRKSKANKIVLWIVVGLSSTLSHKFFRILYCQLFGFDFFTCQFQNSKVVIKHQNQFVLKGLLMSTIWIVVSAWLSIAGMDTYN